jgi:uncharacterized membrane protein
LPARTSSSERLGAWLFIPALAVVLVYLVAGSALPAADCDGISDEASGFAQGMALLVTAGASLCCLAAAGRHLTRLHRDGNGSASLGIAVVVLVVLVGALLISVGDERIVPFFVLGLIATGVCFLALLGIMLAGRTIDEVGVTLPFYLTGMAIFVFPTVLFFFALGNSGLGC